MKKLSIVLFVLFSSMFSNAQILRQQISPATISTEIPAYSQVSTITSMAVSYTPVTPPAWPTPVDGDTTTEGNGMYDYASILSSNITAANGNTTNTTLGKVWTLRISIPNALNVGLIFTSFNLSASAELYIYDDAKTILNKQIKKEHFVNSDTIVISPVKGNAITLYLIEPGNSGSLQSSFIIGKLMAGYRPVMDVYEDSLSIESVACIPHIQCYPGHLNSARAVARMFIPTGSVTASQCTGTLINNELNNGRAYLLTAFHCVDHNNNGLIDAAEIDAVRRAVFNFQFWRGQCSIPSGTLTGIEFNGAIIRSSYRGSDVVLLELINQPGIGDLVNYAGWSRQTTSSSNTQSYIIHHPEGNNMRHTQTRNVRTYLLFA